MPSKNRMFPLLLFMCTFQPCSKSVKFFFFTSNFWFTVLRTSTSFLKVSVLVSLASSHLLCHSCVTYMATCHTPLVINCFPDPIPKCRSCVTYGTPCHGRSVINCCHNPILSLAENIPQGGKYTKHGQPLSYLTYLQPSTFENGKICICKIRKCFTCAEDYSGK